MWIETYFSVCNLRLRNHIGRINNIYRSCQCKWFSVDFELISNTCWNEMYCTHGNWHIFCARSLCNMNKKTYRKNCISDTHLLCTFTIRTCTLIVLHSLTHTHTTKCTAIVDKINCFAIVISAFCFICFRVKISIKIYSIQTCIISNKYSILLTNNS